ncbi:MAG TPA: hypothetical protein VHQ24_12070 [Lachnospiraceae bacterium]|nr:hypothetical protein [Lachnospiraceae bacterium]
MSRVPSKKELVNTRLASGYGSWMYCNSCNSNIGYLCYVTYDDFQFEYTCKCGSHGSIHINFIERDDATESQEKLITIKNRLCCPNDNSPLFTVLAQKLDYYKYAVQCAECNMTYKEERVL